jgi:hypothetical protein
MKKLFAISLLILSSSFLTLSAQTWYWGTEMKPGIDPDGGVLGDHAAATDKHGNVFFTGIFENNLSYGLSNLSTYSTGASADIYLAKCDSNGNPIWAKQSKRPSGVSDAWSYAVATDSKGNAYVTGCFKDTLSFSSFRLIGPSGYGACPFLVKYDSNGNVIWAKQPICTGGGGASYSVATDKAGYIYITGWYGGTLTFGSSTISTIYSDAFVVKYDSNGNVIWAKTTVPLNNSCEAQAYSITTDASCNIYITGYFGGTENFGTFAVNCNYVSAFLTKYDSAGNALWAKQSNLIKGVYAASEGFSVAVDGHNDVYITGDFEDTISFGIDTLRNGPKTNAFLTKYNSAGSLLWAEQSYPLDTNYWKGISVACDTLSKGGGYVLIQSNISGYDGPPFKMKFGGTVFFLNSSPIYQSTAISLLPFDSAGTVSCGTIYSDGIEEDGDAIVVSPSGTQICITGSLTDTNIFGNDSLTYLSETPYLARWKSCENPEGINLINNALSNSIKLFPNPNNGLFTIERSAGKENALVEVYNMLGEKALTLPLSQTGEGTKIDMSAEPDGVYLYRVLSETGNLVSTGKFIINH